MGGGSIIKQNVRHDRARQVGWFLYGLRRDFSGGNGESKSLFRVSVYLLHINMYGSTHNIVNIHIIIHICTLYIHVLYVLYTLLYDGVVKTMSRRMRVYD